MAGITTRARRAPTRDAVGSIAPMIVGTVNFGVVATWGPECGLTELEAKLLIPSVQRTMERLPAAAAAKAAVIIDPLVILTVVGMWGKRIITIQDQRAKEKYQRKPEEIARASGAVDSVYRVPSDQQTANANAAPYRNGAVNGARTEIPVPPSDQINATGGGVPEDIRRSFTNDSDFGSNI